MSAQDTRVVNMIKTATSILGELLPGVAGDVIEEAGAKTVLALLDLLGFETGRVDVVASPGVPIKVTTQRLPKPS